MAESNLDPQAKSWVGARGIMQLMSSTYKEVQSKNPDLGEINDPEWNIAAGISYNRQLWRQWQNESDEAHVSDFMLGSYNAGRSVLLRAQRVARDRALDSPLLAEHPDGGALCSPLAVFGNADLRRSDQGQPGADGFQGQGHSEIGSAFSLARGSAT